MFDLASGALITELPDTFFDVPVLWVHGHTHQRFDYRSAPAGLRATRAAT